MGADPQAILNTNLVAQADYLVAIFKGQLGSPTPRAESGSAEEINVFIDAGKSRRIMWYLYNGTLALDRTESARLQAYVAKNRTNGLYAHFAGPDQLAILVKEHLLRHAYHALAWPAVQKLRTALRRLLAEFIKHDRTQPVAADRALATLDLVLLAINEFLDRKLGRSLTVDPRVLACQRVIRVLIESSEDAKLDWNSADAAMREVDDVLRILPAQEDQL